MSGNSNIRKNPKGDSPVIHPSAYIDPSALIIGNVQIQEDVFVGPLAVIRADEPGSDGKVQPIVIESQVGIQDGVIIHSQGGSSVTVGHKSSIAHGVTIHGPCTIGEGCFMALNTVIYSATLEDYVWMGIGAIVMRAIIPSYLMIPAGAVISSKSDVHRYRLTNDKEQQYQERVWLANEYMKSAYKEGKS